MANDLFSSTLRWIMGLGCSVLVGCGSESDEPAGGDSETTTSGSTTSSAANTGDSGSVTSNTTTGGGSMGGVVVEGAHARGFFPSDAKRCLVTRCASGL